MKTTGKVLLGVGAAVAGVVVIAGVRRARAAQEGAPAAPGTPAAPGPTSSAATSAQAAANAAQTIVDTTLGNATNMTDTLNPAPPDVNNPAPPGSSIVGWKTSDGRGGSEVSPETNRMANLGVRWSRLERSGFPMGATDDMLVKYASWKTFMVTRLLRTMEGWENQFKNLIVVEDAWKKTHPTFVIDRSDASLGKQPTK